MSEGTETFEASQSEDKVLRFEKIYFVGKAGQMHGGPIKLTEQGIAWKNAKTSKVTTIPKEEIKSLKWMRSSRLYELRVHLKAGQTHFCGFRSEDFATVEKFVHTYLAPIEISVLPINTSGIHWGNAEFHDKTTMDFVGGPNNSLIFQIPLVEVSQSTAINKSEVGVEFRQDDGAARDAECVVEMRFFIPEDATPDGETKKSRAVVFREEMLAKADVFRNAGRDAIATFKDVPFLLPRARNDFEIHIDCIRLHGKSYDYRIMLTSIQRLFLLPRPDGLTYFFVINLDPPIRQGQTLYPHLVVQLDRESKEIDLNISDEDLKANFNGKLQRNLTGEFYEVLSSILRVITDRKVVVPKDFKSKSGSQAIKCTLKASDGFLYPLERAFIFVHKPTLFIRFDEVLQVEYQRLENSAGVTSRSFDLEVTLKTNQKHVFNSIPRDEYKNLHDFMTAKGLTIQAAVTENADDILGSDDSGDDDEEDAPRRRKTGDDTINGVDSEEDDASFVGGEASDVAEEFNSSFSSSSSGSDEEGEGGEEGEGESKKRKHKEHKHKKDRKEAKKRAPRGSKKKRKDPNAPKNPLNAYMIWTNTNREKLKEQYPNLSVTEFGKKMGELWKGFTDGDKKEWVDRAQEEKRKYDIAYAEYLKNKPESEEESEEEQTESKPTKKRAPTAKASTKASSKVYKSAEVISSSEDD